VGFTYFGLPQFLMLANTIRSKKCLEEFMWGQMREAKYDFVPFVGGQFQWMT
jgi:hypothetical protein